MSFRLFVKCIFLCSLVFQVFDSNAKLYKVGPSSKTIQIYQNAVSSKPFEVIGKVTVTAVMQNQLRDEITKTTQKFGGDAVVQYRVVQPSSLPGTNGAPVVEQTQPTAQGIVIRFVEQGGVTEITDQTVVPVIN